MPIGSSMVIPYIVEQLYPTPNLILDVGVGLGMNGVICQQYLYADIHLAEKNVVIYGLEPHREYRSPMWGSYYWVFERSLQEVLDDWRKWIGPALDGPVWNLILLTDVIEHFEKEEGVRRLEQLIARLAPGGKLLVSTPAIWIEQGAAYGNEYERHRSLWNCEDFRKLGFEILWDGTPQRGQMMIVAVYKNGEVE